MTVTFELEPKFLLSEEIPLTADDLRFGLWHYYIKPLAVIELAVALVKRGNTDPGIQELAALLHDETDRVEDILGVIRVHEGKIPPEVAEDSESRRKWLYLQLKAAYVERNLLNDPFAVVEQLYTEFGKPTAMSGFVSSVQAPPGEEPEEEPLIQRWELFLDEEHGTLSRSATESR